MRLPPVPRSLRRSLIRLRQGLGDVKDELERARRRENEPDVEPPERTT